MKHLTGLAALAILAAGCGQQAAAPTSKTISPAEAAASAREHLPWFLERLSAGDPADAGFRVTVWMPAESGRKSPELAMRDVTINGASLSGVVNKADPAWPEYAEGQTFTFPHSVVADWSFAHEGRLVGGFLMRARMCEVGQLLGGLTGKTPEAEAALADLGDHLDRAKACQPYDPRADYGGG